MAFVVIITIKTGRLTREFLGSLEVFSDSCYHYPLFSIGGNGDSERSRRVRKELGPRPHPLRYEGEMARTTGIAGCAQSLGIGDKKEDVWTWIQIRIQTPAWQLGRCLTLGQLLLFSDPWFLYLNHGGSNHRGEN